MQSGSKLNPERLFEFVSPFIFVLATRAGQNNQIEFAQMSMCSKICPFQSYSSHLFSNEGWNLRRHGAPLAPTDFTETWWASTPTSALFCFQIFKEKVCFFLLACQETSASQTSWREVIPTAVHLLSHAKVLYLMCTVSSTVTKLDTVSMRSIAQGWASALPCKSHADKNSVSQVDTQAEHDQQDIQQPVKEWKSPSRHSPNISKLLLRSINRRASKL